MLDRVLYTPLQSNKFFQYLRIDYIRHYFTVNKTADFDIMFS